MTEMTQQEAAEAISDLVTKANDAINEAKKIAIKFGVDFSFELAYGMGGEFDSYRGTWCASSESC